MGYLFLLLALSCGLLKAYCGKISSSAVSCSYDAVVLNTVRMILCVFIGLLFVLSGGGAALTVTTPKILAIALLCGISTACFAVLWLLAVRTMAYMLVEVFVMGGVIVPLTLCAFFYKEPIGRWQLIGVILLLAAVYCMCTCKNTDKANLAKKDFLLLLLCSLSSGISDFSQKLYTKEIENANISLFNLYTYLVASIVLLAACFFFKKKEKDGIKIKPLREIVRPIFHYVAIMAVCLFLNAYFKTLSAKYLDAILLYPLNQGCAVLLSLIMSAIIFKEKINAKGYLGVALAIIAMILINIL